MSELTSSEITSICAVVIAVAALITSIWQAFLTRKHNRLSVTPCITTTSRVVEGDPINCVFENHGVGPAKILSVKLSYGNTNFEIENYDDFKSFFRSINVNLDDDISHTVTATTTPATLAPGKSVTFFDFPDSGEDTELYTKLLKAMDELDIEIIYECIYGVSYKTSTKKT